jgi:FAD/FMN-containing dehydrogenase
MAAPASVRPPAADAAPLRHDYLSWGRYPRVPHRRVQRLAWQDQLPEMLGAASPGSLLAYGLGRSYGDVCLNGGRDLLDCSSCNRILEADWQTGRLRVEAGLSLADLLEVIVPRGWFLPVTPGTKFATVGGAVANDVHGKNHHRAGTFGCHVSRLLLHRSDRGALVCSPTENADLFRATIGGLGLTGVIAWVELHLKAARGNALDVETLRFQGLDEFLKLSEQSDRDFEYTVAWIDCFAGARARGLIYRGNHAGDSVPHGDRQLPSVPCAAPDWLLGPSAVRLFNWAYSSWHGMQPKGSRTHYDPFFYPLDAVPRWNLLYGKRGLVQYQCVLPPSEVDALARILSAISASRQGSFLAVLKTFGTRPSPGLLSFPRPGLTLALDFPLRGAATERLLAALDDIVLRAGGALYPAKDARMPAGVFQASYPQWREFLPFVDAKCSSSFWRRVTGQEA